MTGAAKQSRAARLALDCFVACAPRNDGKGEVRQINPSGQSMLIFRNRVKPLREKYFAGYFCKSEL
jgi:hypothetical protein